MKDHTEEFLRALFEGKPDASAIQIWHRISERESKTFTYNSIRGAADANAGKDGYDIYVAAGLAPKQARPSRTRAKASEIVGIPGVWADIDVNGGPDNKTGAAPSQEKALSLSRALLEPTIIVHSGYGIQAWWLFEDGPWAFQTIDEREQGARLSEAFQGALRAEARRQGWGLDSTGDLARVMRLPGTFNHKGRESAPVVILEHSGCRYSIEDIGQLSHTHLADSGGAAARLMRGEGIAIKVTDNPAPPMLKLQQLIDMDEGFKPLWDHSNRKRREEWSLSEYEMAMTNFFVAAGWTDQEICDALCFHRLRWEPGDPKRKNRADRISLTIGKVRATTGMQAAANQIRRERDDAADQLEAMQVVGGKPDVIRTVSLFNKLIGGPEIAQLQQNSTDPLLARYTLVMADGREVPIGTIDNLTNQQKFANIYAVVTQHLPEHVTAKKWANAVSQLLKTAVVTEDEGEGYGGTVLKWIAQHVSRSGSHDRNGACRVGDPFVANNKAYVYADTLHEFIRRVKGERIELPDLWAWLRLVAERETVNYERDDGSKSSRSYYAVPIGLLEGEA